MTPIPRNWEVAKLPPKADAFRGLLDRSAHIGEAESCRLPPLIWYQCRFVQSA